MHYISTLSTHRTVANACRAFFLAYNLKKGGLTSFKMLDRETFFNFVGIFQSADNRMNSVVLYFTFYDKSEICTCEAACAS